MLRLMNALKFPVINKISYVLHYFYYIMHSHILLQEVHHIWYQSTCLGSLGGISANIFCFAILLGAMIIAVVLLLAMLIFI